MGGSEGAGKREWLRWFARRRCLRVRERLSGRVEMGWAAAGGMRRGLVGGVEGVVVVGFEEEARRKEGRVSVGSWNIFTLETWRGFEKEVGLRCGLGVFSRR